MPTPRISCEVSNFNLRDYPKLINQCRELNVSWADLIHASIMVGKSAYAEVVRYGLSSKFEMLFKIAMLKANLIEENGGYVKSKLYLSLDPTEKAAISYYLGMTMSYVVANKLLGIKRLVHLDNMRKAKRICFSGPMRPDLIGEDNTDEWVVVEAKGRTNTYSQTAQNKAKQQSLSITSINGKKPKVHTACQTYFGKNMKIKFEDPEPEYEGLEIDINRERFLDEYYEPFTRVEDLKEVNYSEGEFFEISLEQTGVTVGIYRNMYEALSSKGNLAISKPLEYDKNYQLRVSNTPNFTLFSDGVFVLLDDKYWNN